MFGAIYGWDFIGSVAEDKDQQSWNDSKGNEYSSRKVDWKEGEAQGVEEFSVIKSKSMRDQEVLTLGCYG